MMHGSALMRVLVSSAHAMATGPARFASPGPSKTKHSKGSWQLLITVPRSMSPRAGRANLRVSAVALVLAALCIMSAVGLGTAGEAKAAGGARQCGKVLIRHHGVLWARAYEIIAWKVSCRRTRRIVRGYLNHIEGNRVRPRPFGFRCRSAAKMTSCRKGRSIVSWSFEPKSAGCRFYDAPYPCLGEHPCGRVPSISEGVRIKSSVFTRGYSCSTARGVIGLGGPPAGWIGTGSGAGGIWWQGSSDSYPGQRAVMRMPHVRYSNIVL